MTPAFILIVLLVSELPDPGRVSTITFATTFGTVLAALIVHLRRLPPEQAAAAMRIGLIVGFLTGAIVWLTVLAIDRL